MRFFLTRLFDVSLLAFFIVATMGLWFFPEIVQGLVTIKTFLVAGFGLFLSGPAWLGYGRLTALDKLDGLNSARRDQVNEFIMKIRKRFLKIIALASCFLLMSIVALILAENNPIVPVFTMSPVFFKSMFIVVTLSATGAFFFRSLLQTITLLLVVEQNRQKVADWQHKEISRKKLVEQLRKSKTDQPLPADDPHLLKYRNAINFQRIDEATG
ncbi:hypothetical protein [Collimonas humicola]|uniref:hypothetical protein n=1 Tax=Collimonas humicola TaxID=2825886 RepID=UPI001B8CE737|nr:hypothetical protein [Collimonas humicola]